MFRSFKKSRSASQEVPIISDILGFKARARHQWCNNTIKEQECQAPVWRTREVVIAVDGVPSWQSYGVYGRLRFC